MMFPEIRSEAPSQAAQPCVLIRPRRGWQALELREARQYRHLVLAFFWRDLKAQ